MKPTVFIHRDVENAAMLDRIAADLGATGVNVLRGKLPSGPGNRADYDEEAANGFFAECDAMMFGTRSYCSRNVLESAPKLLGLVNPTIGLDTVDVQAANALGIIIGHGPVPENYIGMAEATVMLILNLMYQLHVAQEVLRGTRSRPPLTDAHASMLRGRTIGMIGFGRIARCAAQRLAAFDVRILVATRSRPADLPGDVERVEADAVFGESDVVCLFASADESNRKLVDAKALARMKRTAYFVNTARGSLVDEDALYLALKERRIAGAALDTFVTEPLPTESPLRMLDNVILTPHMVGHTKEVLPALVDMAIQNVTRILRHELPVCCKNPQIEPAWRVRLSNLPARDAHPPLPLR